LSENRGPQRLHRLDAARVGGAPPMVVPGFAGPSAAWQASGSRHIDTSKWLIFMALLAVRWRLSDYEL